MKDKKFPTILGIIFLLVILFLGVFLSTKTTSLNSKASVSCEPVNPQITNLTFGSFDFSFTTPSPCSATLSINNIIYQDASLSETTHYFKISNLSPKTSYKFSLISGSSTYSRPEYVLTTASKPNSLTPSSNLAWGRVIDSMGNPISGAIIYLTLPGSQALSAFSNKNGNWNISLAASFNEQKTDWFTPSTTAEEDITVYSPDGQVTQLTNPSSNNDPVPDIIIGQNYFSNVPTPISSTKSSFDINNSELSFVSLSITNPREGENVSTLKPDIFGQGPAGKNIQLNLDGKLSSITVADNNSWNFSPSQNLSIGSHQISLTYQDQIVTRNFLVTGTSDYLSFSATPSATLIPTQNILPTIVSSPTPTTVPTSVPTIRTAKPSTTSTLYKSGNSFPTYLIVILSLLFFSVSLYYYH
ncbi:MAG TPA: hypothetical protein PKI92_00125 [Candidatus Woesebacteria bacterium]|nr:hypothetical protein [Candidatus Woesebacteria bacterium]HPR99722.1 hypothetical protein [Candidatus Woesebacteria bacterium]